MEYLNAALLGLIEGLTEFLPVSSTGHLILASDLLGFKGPEGHLFEISIQLGAILAVCWLYRTKLITTAFGMFRSGPEQRFALNIILAFIPAMVLGALFHQQITTLLFSPHVVSVMLIWGGVMILLIERMNKTPRILSLDALPLKTSLAIGFCQALAMIPGVSRSGATIMGALLLGLERKTAAEFSFFLAIPTMLAATVYSLYKGRHSITLDDMSLVAIGFIVAFITALIVVRAAIGLISRHGFAPFAWYRIVLGCFMLWLLM